MRKGRGEITIHASRLTLYLRLTHYLLRFTSEPLLPERLEQYQRRAVRQIQRARSWIEHRDAKPAIPVFLEPFFGESRRLAPEDQVIARHVGNFGVMARAIGFQ